MNSAILPVSTYASDPELCWQTIANHLGQGQLALFLGAGASSGMGLPSWADLVAGCSAKAGLSDSVGPNTTSESLMQIVDNVETATGAKYHDIVTECLYENAKDDVALLNQHLLSVIGALTANSRRGSIGEVVTLNFDDVLERYLSLHGFTSQVITQLPELRREVDVTVYHPHGFLPSDPIQGQPSSEIIFSQYSFDDRLGENNNPWQDLVRDLLLRKVGLFVGLTPGSATLRTIITAVGDKLNKTRGPTGFWLVGPTDDENVESMLTKRNIVPIRMSNYGEYVDVVLRICQIAARNTT